MPDDESTSFDPIAESFDEWAAHNFPQEIVNPMVDLLAQLAGSGRALELGIGTGRIALPLAARGVSVSGIELSPKMAAKLREKSGGADIPAAIGDFSSTRVDGSFSLAYLVANTLWNLKTQEKQVACFQNVAAHLEPSGRFLVEMFVPDLQGISTGHTIRAFRADAGRLSFDVYDVPRQGLTSVHYSIASGGITAFAPEGRYVWPAEMDLMAQLAGMKLENRWGGWKREPFTELSRSHVSVYEKPQATGRPGVSLPATEFVTAGSGSTDALGQKARSNQP
ncbi:MAG: class I SAM-dependent methyltransferase [Dehalococcoidia bacterium]